MEEDAPPKKSVAELAGKFKAHAPPFPTGTDGSNKPVRRRPPRTLHLPKTTAQGQVDEEKPISPSLHPAKTKRNSALIEKLQANLALSPCSLLPSPKSPGLKLLPPSFTPTSTCSPIPPVTTVTPTSPVSRAPLPRSLSEEETPATFEVPATPTDGSLLPSINKGRARLSIRRRPPSRRHRKSSGEEGDGVTGEEMPLTTPDDPEAKVGEEEKGEGEEVFEKEVEEKDGERADTTMYTKEKIETGSSTPANSQQQIATTDRSTTDPDPLEKTKSEKTLERQTGEERQEDRQTGEEATGSRGEEVKDCGQGCGGEEKEKGRETCSVEESSTEREKEEGEELACKEKEGERDTDCNEEKENTKL
ncbi:capZ-interacting protein isoform X1 [Oncorhynchus mykiss]|uniref:capZ-interacting protein isoform X1 n=1 Tax=Oncorhynchus mykiss TaxID=8022 RepID=UPI001877787C|nr:capZ-interacting protein isoform X1 [Oncorhynchus mykiss]